MYPYVHYMIYIFLKNDDNDWQGDTHLPGEKEGVFLD